MEKKEKNSKLSTIEKMFPRYKPTIIIPEGETNIYYSILTSLLFYIIVVILINIFLIYTKNYCLAYLSGFLFPFLYISYKYKKKIRKDVKNFKKDFLDNYKNILLVSIILIIIEIVLYQLIIHFFNTGAHNQSMLEAEIKSNILLAFIYSLLGPVAEEVVFRLPYYNAKGNKKIIYIVYSLIFALSHISAEVSLVAFLVLIPYLILSFAIGYGFYKTNNIFMSMLVHIINNSIAIMILFI